MTVQEKITISASMYGVDPNLALAIADRESGFDQNARGADGEVGVFQLMEGTARDLGVDRYNLDGNIAGGVRYLAQQFATFGGDPFKAVAAYNAGPGYVAGKIRQYGDQDWFNHIYESTQDYVTAVVPQVPGTIVYAGGPGAPITPARIEPLAMAAALAAGLLVLYSFTASENPPEWEDLFL